MTTENLSTTEAAEMLDLSKNKIRDMISDGSLPNAFKEGRSWRIPKSDLLALSAEGSDAIVETVMAAAEETSEVVETVSETVDGAVAETTDAVEETIADAADTVETTVEETTEVVEDVVADSAQAVAETTSSAEETATDAAETANDRISEMLSSLPSINTDMGNISEQDPLLLYLFGGYIGVMLIAALIGFLF